MTPQFIADGLISGITIGLGAAGVTLTYSILRFANFAQGEFISWGCYLTLAIAGAIGAWFPSSVDPIGPMSIGWNVAAAGMVAMVLTGLLAAALDVVLRPLRARGGSMSAVIASFGAAMALRALIELIFSSRQAYFSQDLQIAIPILAGMRLTPDEIVLIGVAIALVGALHLLLTRTDTGRSMRAVSENPALASMTGIDVQRVMHMTAFIGGALACASGITLGLVVQIRPSMGSELLLPLFAAAILGGIGSVPGALLGGLTVGLAEAVTAQFVGAQWRAGVAFLVLIGVLLIRPTGLFGGRA